MTGHNVLVIMSDEHMRDAAGCYGHPVVKTPNLDRLASRGTRFSRAYTPSPICVPARAALATGKYVHQTKFWSSAQAYDGSDESWGHRLIQSGYPVNSIGKLHYKSGDTDNGFQTEAHSLHIRNGVGWACGLLRKQVPDRGKTADFRNQIGPGECDYTTMDRNITRDACTWLRTQAPRHTDNPWTLFTSYITPHYPLIVPREFYDMYPPDEMEPPQPARPGDGTDHPVVKGVRDFMNYDDHFDDESRQLAVAAYFGLCSFLDDNIGQVLQALEDSGQADNTIIMYFSDHGEMLGTKGMWTKCTMYEKSAAIPMIIVGPDIPVGHVCKTPVSLVDIHPTILDAVGLKANDSDAIRPGRSLIETANDRDQDRAILSEYHDGGSITGMFMIRHGRWKYCYYPGYNAQLFDMDADPEEHRDLGTDPGHEQVRAACHKALLKIVDPDAANERAFADQAERINELGGVDAVMATEDFDFTPVE